MYGGYYPQPATRDEVIELVGLREKRDTRVQQALGRPAAAAGRGGRARRRPGAALPRRAHDGLRPERAPQRVGDREEPRRRSARPSSSRRTSWTRRSTWPTASRSSRRARSSPRARPTRSPGATRCRPRDPVPAPGRRAGAAGARTGAAGRRLVRDPTPTTRRRALHALTGWALEHGVRVRDPRRHAAQPRGRLPGDHRRRGGRG